MYLVKEMLPANCSNFANVVEKADRSFCCSVAFVDMNVPKPLQEIGPGISSYPISDGNTDFMISVSVALERTGEHVYLYTYVCCIQEMCLKAAAHVDFIYNKHVSVKHIRVSPPVCCRGNA